MKKYIFYGSGLVLLWTLARYIRSRRNAIQGAIAPVSDDNPPDDGNASDGAIVPMPDDALIQVFKICPTQSIMQFQGVCKDWRRVIKSPDMVQTHLKWSQQTPFLLLQDGDDKYDVLNHLFILNSHGEFHELHNPLVDPLMRGCIVGSSNGLICLALGDDRSHLSTLLVWNPETRKTRPVFLRTEVDCLLGFGFGGNDCKIVMLYVSKGVFVYRVEVFSLYTMPPIWKEVEFGSLLENFEFDSDGVTVTGAGVVVWHVSEKTKDGPTSLLAMFDIAKEDFSLVPLPPLDPATTLAFKLAEYDEKLALLSPVHLGDLIFVIELWVIDEQVWTKKGSTGPLTPGLWEPVTILGDEIVCAKDQIFEEVQDVEDGEVLAEKILSMHNPTTNGSRMTGTHRFQDPDYILNYVKSLVPVENGGD